MGTYNTVTGVSLACPACGVASVQNVQFKYGRTWQIAYSIGDTLQWGRLATGTPGKPAVVVDGAVEGPCGACGFDRAWDAYVFLREDRIVHVTNSDGRYASRMRQATHAEVSAAEIPLP